MTVEDDTLKIEMRFLGGKGDSEGGHKSLFYTCLQMLELKHYLL